MLPDAVKNESGIAILITITVITLLVAASLELNRKIRSQVISTITFRDRFILTQIAESGINVAMAMIAQNKKESEIVSIQQDWADPEKIDELISKIPFEEGNLKLKITDELGKIQINALVVYPHGVNFNEPQKMLWDRLLRNIISEQESLADIDPTLIINCTKDWIDSKDDDAITGLNGSESEYYQDLDPPYACRNGPLPDLDELVLIKGITSELFRGVGEAFGISAFMTVYGATDAGGNNFTYEGRININTAELPVIAALLPSENNDLALEIYNYRKEFSDSKYLHDLSNPRWYKNAYGCGDLTIDPKLIKTSSDIFQIESAAILNELTMLVKVVVQIEKDKKTGKPVCRVLSRRVE